MSMRARKTFLMLWFAIPAFVSLSGFGFILLGHSAEEDAPEVEARRPNEPIVMALKTFDKLK